MWKVLCKILLNRIDSFASLKLVCFNHKINRVIRAASGLISIVTIAVFSLQISEVLVHQLAEVSTVQFVVMTLENEVVFFGKRFERVVITGRLHKVVLF